MTAEEIRKNYNELIRYNQIWYRGTLRFPTLPMSASAGIHFKEVKAIFDFLQGLCFTAGAASLAILLSTRGKNRRWLAITGAAGLGLILLTGIMILSGWERFFILFHQLVFRNDYWLFDPAEDPVILLLPDTYFLQCAVLILVLIIAACTVCLCAGRNSSCSREKASRSKQKQT